MKADINIMKDRLEVLQFVYSQSAVIGKVTSPMEEINLTEQHFDDPPID